MRKVNQRTGQKSGAVTQEEAEEIAARALLFLAEEPARLGRFLAETGLDPSTLRGRARSPEVLAAALGHVCEDESTLLAFAVNANVPADKMVQVMKTLGLSALWDST